MSGNNEVTYAVDFGRQNTRTQAPDGQSLEGEAAVRAAIPRIARLMALAIRFEGLLRERKIRDYSELAHCGRVTRSRITQIMKLLHLAPDIQEQLLFLPLAEGLNERILRNVVSPISWDEQRRIFRELKRRLEKGKDTGRAEKPVRS